MVTVDPGVRASAADVAARAPRAVATNLDMLHVVPPGAMAYVTCGDDEARAFKGRPPAALAGSRALFVNRAEALALTGEPTVEQAAAALGELAESVVVSLGADGGLIATAGRDAHGAGRARRAPVDTTGAGDLLAAAYIWADLARRRADRSAALGRPVREPRRDHAHRYRRRTRRSRTGQGGYDARLERPTARGRRSQLGDDQPHACDPRFLSERRNARQNASPVGTSMARSPRLLAAADCAPHAPTSLSRTQQARSSTEMARSAQRAAGSR